MRILLTLSKKIIFYDKSWIINKGGYVFKNKNSEELAKKMNKMLNEKENLPQMGLYGFNYAMKHYNWKAIAEEYAKVFNAFL